MEFHHLKEIFKLYLNEMVRLYENMPLSGCYVRLPISRLSEGRPVSPDFFGRQWHATSDPPCALLLLGDYGTGKSSFCFRLVHDMALQCRQGYIERIPILIRFDESTGRLKNFSHYILSVLEAKHRITALSTETFDAANEAGHFILIFDGFDKLAKRIDSDAVTGNINAILKAVYPRSKVLVTCRNEYFYMAKQMRDNLIPGCEETALSSGSGFEIYSIDFLTDALIRQFVKRQTKENFSAYYKRLEEEKNIFALAHRPLFLDKIMKIFEQIIHIDIPKPNISTIYKIYISKHLEKQYSGPGSVLSKTLVHRILVKIAETMHSNRTNLISQTNLENLIRNDFSRDLKQLNVGHEEVRRSIITHTFLSKADCQNYQFSDPSLQYYFRALCLYEGIKNNNKALFQVEFIGAETILFIKDMYYLKLKDTLLEWLEDSDANIQKYAVIFLGFIGAVESEENDKPLHREERQGLIGLLRKKADLNQSDTDTAHTHIAKHAKLAVSILGGPQYHKEIGKIAAEDPDYTHRWYALIGIEKMIDSGKLSYADFKDVIEHVIEAEEISDIVQLAKKIKQNAPRPSASDSAPQRKDDKELIPQ